MLISPCEGIISATFGVLIVHSRYILTKFSYEFLPFVTIEYSKTSLKQLLLGFSLYSCLCGAAA